MNFKKVSILSLVLLFISLSSFTILTNIGKNGDSEAIREAKMRAAFAELLIVEDYNSETGNLISSIELEPLKEQMAKHGYLLLNDDEANAFYKEQVFAYYREVYLEAPLCDSTEFEAYASVTINGSTTSDSAIGYACNGGSIRAFRSAGGYATGTFSATASLTSSHPGSLGDIVQTFGPDSFSCGDEYSGLALSYLNINTGISNVSANGGCQN